MIGAGVFSAFAPAAAAAGSGLLLGLAIAAVVAFCNATSSAQLAAVYPQSGGSYVYGRVRLGEWWGYLAGWSFVIGKVASCAAMALVFASYVAPAGWERAVAVAAVLALAAVNYFGVTRTARLTRVIVVVVLVCLGVALVAASTSGLPSPGSFDAPNLLGHGWLGVLQSAGLLFFAFAGYARIATMGEEVRDPARTIPRAIVVALALAVLLYGLVAVVLLGALGPVALASSATPVLDAAELGTWGWVGPVVRIGAAVAALGALLGLIAGVGRTSLAMARNDDLPRWLAAVHPKYRTPHHAEIAVAAVVVLLVLVVDLRGAIGFSSFGVLLYYVVANVSALTQPGEQRRFPRWVQVLGVVGCLALVVTLPPHAVAVGVAVLVVGVLYRLVARYALRSKSARRSRKE